MISDAVAIHQPALPWYRLGLFNALSDELSRPLVIAYHADIADSKTVATQTQHRFQSVPVRDRHWANGRVRWSGVQLRLAFDRRFSVVVYPWNSRYLSLPPAIAIARLRRKRVLLWGHGYSKSDSHSRSLIRNAIGHMASALLLYSDRAQDRLSIPLRSKSTVVGNAIFGRDYPGQISSESPQNDELSIVHIGRMRADRRLEVVIGAVLDLQRRGILARLTIVGDGPHLDSLRAEAKRLGVESRIEFRGAIYSDAAIAALLWEADVATAGAAGGLGVLDCLEHSVPVALMGAPEHHGPEAHIVFDLFPELVDPTCTPKGMADALMAVRSLPDLARRIGEARDEIALLRWRMVKRFREAIDAVQQGP